MSDETRSKIVAKYESGKPPCVISNELEIKYKAVKSVLKTYKNYGRLQAIKKRAKKTKKITPDTEAFIKVYRILFYEKKTFINK